MGERLSVLVVGAHPDDAEIQAGGLSILYARAGHRVGFVSMTNGDAGHYRDRGAALAERRRQESLCSARTAGIESTVMDIHDGELEPTLENRKKLITLIRGFSPDLIITHRANDYHPDHRYTSILVQDASFLITVPNICPESPHLRHTPVILYLSDRFTKPAPFRPDIAIGIDEAMSAKMDMLHCHTSQVYEFMPYSWGHLHEVPEGESERRAWLESRWLQGSSAGEWRDLLVKYYGPEKGGTIRCAEAFEVSEYGAPLDDLRMKKLFPFVTSA